MAYSTIDKSTANFNTYLYTGNGSTNTISGLGHQPDWVWTKRRDNTGDHALYDSVRGVSKMINSNSGNAESTVSGVTTFGTDGFTLGSGGDSNGNSETYASWNWKAGGAAPTQTYTVKVVSDGGNKYRFDDFGTSAVTLDLQEGGTYTFDVSDSSLNSHPFVIGTAANSSEYSTGVTYKLDGVTKTYSQYTSGFSAATSRQLIITVADSAPALYYWCSVHSGMGGAINTNTTHGSSNFDGSIQTKISANTTAGFSIVQWTGTGSSGTIAHGLGAVPGFIWVKKTSQSDSWFVWHTELGTQGKMNLDNDSAIQNDTGYWNNTLPTNQVFSVTSNGANNATGETYIAYCFASVTGYCKIGYHEGNANADGPFIYTGFAPNIVFIKSVAQNHWMLRDSKRPGYNMNQYKLFPDRNVAENTDTSNKIDLLSNGFKLRESNTEQNGNGTKYIYMAIGQTIVGNNNIVPTAR